VILGSSGAGRTTMILAAAALAFSPDGLIAQQSATNWRIAAPRSVMVVGRLEDPRLAEASGAAASRANPGLFWTIGDSGNPPDLLAVDSTGRLQAVIPILATGNIDWEAVAVGRCGGSTCVYIADVGDNDERRQTVYLHRLIEPRLVRGDHPVTRPPSVPITITVRYPDHPHDVEAVGVDPNGDLLLVSKGRSDGVLIFTVPASAWDHPLQPVVATAAGSLPIRASLGTGEVVTDLAIDLSGERVAIRTYRTIYLFRRGADGRLSPDRWAACNVLGTEPQGEGITWLDGWRLLMTSERGLFPAGTVTIVDCRPDSEQ
jgi:hypothetical protein